MSHVYHDDLKGIVLYDGCGECEEQATRLWELDVDQLRTVAALDRYGAGHESYSDRKALETLELYARLVADSGITEDDE